tara:strand:- start:3913 stop:5643 length:1731 start_codon:yes stop_codon:yes gene_type:complete
MLGKKYLNTLFSTLDKRQKFKMLFFGFFILIITFLESFGLGMFYPFLQSITDNEINSSIREFYFKIKSIIKVDTSIEVLSILIVAIIIVTKNIISFIFEYWQLTFLNELRLNLKSKILKSHFQNDYEISSNIKMSTYVRDFNSTIENFVNTFNYVIQFFIEIAIFIGILILISIIQSKQIIIFSISIALFALTLFLILRKLITSYGKKHLDLQDRSLKKLIDILNSTKEIIIFKKESIFIKHFKSIEFKSLNLIKIVSLIQKFPKFFFESLVIVSFTIFIFYSKNQGIELSNLLPQLSIVFLALIKLLPAITKILFYSQKLNFAEQAAIKISEDIKTFNRVKSEAGSEINLLFKNSIELRDLEFKYKNRENLIFKNLNLRINKGDYVGIYGPSGGGKTTLIGLFCGFYKPNKGKIIIDGKEIRDLRKTNWLNHVSYLTQENNLIDETILRNVTFEFDDNKVDFNLFEEVSNQSGLNKLIQKLPDKFNTEVGQKGITISGGERQRIGIARSLYAKKEILIFDESTSNLDDENKLKFIETLNELSSTKTIIIISHDRDVIENCKNKYSIKNNNLFSSF